MLIIYSGNSCIKSQTNVQITQTNEYRLSNFVIKEALKDGFLLYHTATCSLVYLEGDEDMEQSFLQLVCMWYFVKIDFNEFLWIDNLRKERSNALSKDVKRYTIFTTTDCNARCFYCYEKRLSRLFMTEKTAMDVAAYIIRNAKGSVQSIRWFGGEPLMNCKVIDLISEQLQRKDVQFYSKMITNGTLFDVGRIKKALTL